MAITKVTGGLLGNLAVGTNNVAVGNTALDSLTSGVKNTAVGSNAGTAITEGTFNNAVGFQALLTLSTGSNNDAFGGNAWGLLQQVAIMLLWVEMHYTQTQPHQIILLLVIKP